TKCVLFIADHKERCDQVAVGLAADKHGVVILSAFMLANRSNNFRSQEVRFRNKRLSTRRRFTYVLSVNDGPAGTDKSSILLLDKDSKTPWQIQFPQSFGKGG